MADRTNAEILKNDLDAAYGNTNRARADHLIALGYKPPAPPTTHPQPGELPELPEGLLSALDTNPGLVAAAEAYARAAIATERARADRADNARVEFANRNLALTERAFAAERERDAWEDAANHHKERADHFRAALVNVEAQLQAALTSAGRGS